MKELGPCMVYFGTADAEVVIGDVGDTEGGVTINFTNTYADLLSDQHGASPLDKVIVGRGATINVPIADVDLDAFAIVMGQTKKRLGADVGVAGESLVGTKLSTLAQSLLLKKYVDGVVSTEAETDGVPNWIRFPVCAPSAETLALVFDKTTQRTLPAVFFAMPDANSRLYFAGDETAAVDGS